MLAAICNAFAGEPTNANNDLRRLMNSGRAPRIDALLAQRFAGAAGDGRRSVTIEWDNVDELTPWRAALARAEGVAVPAGLTADAPAWFAMANATAPMLSPLERAPFAEAASRRGVLSSSAAIDLYAQVFAEESGTDADETAQNLRLAYVGANGAARIDALRAIWSGAQGDPYGRYVLTAYAAARVIPVPDYAADAAPLLASMLAAGLDRDAERWTDAIESGSTAWGILAVARTDDQRASNGGLDSFLDNDDSARQQRSRMLLAGLSGLDRIGSGARSNYEESLGIRLDRQTRWTQAIDAAARNGNPTLVILLAGLGMQGDSWGKMTAVHLYHIVRALGAVGLEGEARMIAAEAVARA